MPTTYHRKYEASPIYSFRNSATISAGSSWTVDIGESSPTSKKYLPMNTVQITNNSSYDIYFYPNQDTARTKVVPAGTIITFQEQDIPALSTFKLYNAGSGNITSNQIEVATWRTAVTVDTLAKEIHKILFKRGYIRA